MTETKYTRGPWKLVEIHDDDRNLTHMVASEYDDSIVTYALPRTFANEELMANAKLIAAAPELLECLRIAVKNELDDVYRFPSSAQKEWMNRARAALIKAGQGVGE